MESNLVMKISPLLIEICLHYYWSPEDMDGIDSPAGKEIAEHLISLGILTEGDHRRKYIGNHAALKVYVDTLLDTPLPEKQWVIPNNEHFNSVPYGELSKEEKDKWCRDWYKKIMDT